MASPTRSPPLKSPKSTIATKPKLDNFSPASIIMHKGSKKSLTPELRSASPGSIDNTRGVNSKLDNVTGDSIAQRRDLEYKVITANEIHKRPPDSISVALHQKLVAGEFNRRDGLIGLIFLFLMLIASFGGAGVCFSMERHYDDTNQTVDFCYSATFNLTNYTETSDLNSSYLLWWNDTEFDVERLYECIRNEASSSVVHSFDDSAIYVITIMTTIGFGHKVVTGFIAQAVMIIYAILSIPLFFAAADFVSDVLREGFARTYKSVVKLLLRRRSPMKKKPGWLANNPDFVPFLAVVAITITYTSSTSGVFYALATFETYTDALYYFFQSSFLIGFGDVLPLGTPAQLVSILFVIFAILMTVFIVVVLEGWLKKAIRSFVDRITAKPKTKMPGEQTLEDLVAGSRWPQYATMRRLAQKSPGSIHERPFNVSRFRVTTASNSEEEEEPSHLANVHI